MKRDVAKVRVSNLLLVVAMLFGGIVVTAVPAQAQEEKNAVFLPILVGNNVVGINTQSLPDLPDASMLNALSIEPAVHAAGSCYDNLQHNVTISGNPGWTDYYYQVSTANCRDLNIKVTPGSARCDVYIEAYYYKPSEGRWIQGSGSHRYISFNNWFTPITNLYDGRYTAIAFWNNGRCDRINIKITS